MLWLELFGILCCYAVFTQGLKIKYTEQEISALEKFRPMVESLLTQDYMKEDIYSLKFLRDCLENKTVKITDSLLQGVVFSQPETLTRSSSHRFYDANKLNVASASDHLKKTMTWRKENNMDNILNENFDDVAKQNPFNMDAVDKDGAPVVILPFKSSQWDIRKYAVSGNRNLLTRYYDWMLETVASRLRALGNSSTVPEDVKGVLIFDIIGHNVRQHGCLTCLPMYLEWMQHGETHFPETFKKVFLINAPRGFSPLWQILKPALAPSTRKILDFHGPNKKEWSAALLKVIPAEQLTSEYGGTKTLNSKN